jgi:pseudaminic acid synthase
MDEAEFTAMVNAVREAEKAIGVVDYTLTDKQAKGKDFSRSLYVVQDLKKGDLITQDNVKSIRPGFGLHPKHYTQILGKMSNQDLEKGTRMRLDFLDNEILK